MDFSPLLAFSGLVQGFLNPEEGSNADASVFFHKIAPKKHFLYFYRVSYFFRTWRR